MQPNRFFIFLMMSFFFLMSCGPMNAPPKNSPDGSLGVTQISKNSQFMVHVSLNSTSGESTSSPSLGENNYLFHLVYARNFSACSSDARLSVTYWMPEMLEMGKSEEAITLQPDGSYTTTLFFSMSGRWQVTISIKDNNVEDEYTFETDV